MEKNIIGIHWHRLSVRIKLFLATRSTSFKEKQFYYHWICAAFSDIAFNFLRTLLTW